MGTSIISLDTTPDMCHTLTRRIRHRFLSPLPVRSNDPPAGTDAAPRTHLNHFLALQRNSRIKPADDGSTRSVSAPVPPPAQPSPGRPRLPISRPFQPFRRPFRPLRLRTRLSGSQDSFRSGMEFSTETLLRHDLIKNTPGHPRPLIPFPHPKSCQIAQVTELSQPTRFT